mmetsp:Transcript_51139/g.147577  ORF Transcript_51139/g.147577 Transcript_51139/m.147577 type:complete len:332 (-) Transcript_51139:133-1128(-)
MEGVQFIVKNTFVHVCDAESVVSSAERRSTSVPSSLRFGGAPALRRAAADEDVKLVPPAAPAPAVGGSRWSDVSTSWDSASEGESIGSGTNRCCEPHTAGGASKQQTHSPAPAPAAVAAPPRPELRLQQGRRHRGKPQRNTTASQEMAVPAPSGANVQAGHRSAGGSKLSCPETARLPAPAAASRVAMVPAQPGGFVAQLAVVIAAAAAALEGLSFIKSAKTTQGPRGSSIVAQVRKEDAGCREKALEAARDALLRAATGSTCVHILGAKAQPFMSTPVGFAAHIGAVADEGKACWSMINQGFCRRGCACRWEHPVSQTMVNVMVQVERGS